LAVWLVISACSSSDGNGGSAKTIVDSEASGAPTVDSATDEELTPGPDDDDTQADSVTDVVQKDNSVTDIVIDETVRGDDLPVLENVLAEFELSTPCDLFSADELGTFVSTSAQSTGLLEELPAGLNTLPISFVEVSSTESSCEWFSESHLWFTSVSWEPADPTFVASLFEGNPTFGDTYEAMLVGDTSARLLVGDLFVIVTSLPPGHTTLSADADLTRALLAEVGEKLR